MHNQHTSVYGMLAVALLLLNAVIMETALLKNSNWYSALYITLPLFILAIYLHKKRTPAKREKPMQEVIPGEQYNAA